MKAASGLMGAVNLAHLGGIDELGAYVIPIVLAIVALRWAEKRAKASAAERDGEQGSMGSRDPAGHS